jgi:hypothetical protein
MAMLHIAGLGCGCGMGATALPTLAEVNIWTDKQAEDYMLVISPPGSEFKPGVIPGGLDPAVFDAINSKATRYVKQQQRQTPGYLIYQAMGFFSGVSGWLHQDTFITGVPNGIFALAAGAGILYLIFKKSGG